MTDGSPDGEINEFSPVPLVQLDRKKKLGVVETRTFDFFNTRKVFYLSEKMD